MRIRHYIWNLTTSRGGGEISKYLVLYSASIIKVIGLTLEGGRSQVGLWKRRYQYCWVDIFYCMCVRRNGTELCLWRMNCLTGFVVFTYQNWFRDLWTRVTDKTEADVQPKSCTEDVSILSRILKMVAWCFENYSPNLCVSMMTTSAF